MHIVYVPKLYNIIREKFSKTRYVENYYTLLQKNVYPKKLLIWDWRVLPTPYFVFKYFQDFNYVTPLKIADIPFYWMAKMLNILSFFNGSGLLKDEKLLLKYVTKQLFGNCTRIIGTCTYFISIKRQNKIGTLELCAYLKLKKSRTI